MLFFGKKLLWEEIQKSHSVNTVEEKHILDFEQLVNGCVLTNPMWYFFSLYFGNRGRLEQYSMKIDDFVLNKFDENIE